MARSKVTHPLPLRLQAAEPVTKSRDELREELSKLARRDSFLSKSIDKASETIRESNNERKEILLRSWTVQRALETLEKLV